MSTSLLNRARHTLARGLALPFIPKYAEQVSATVREHHIGGVTLFDAERVAGLVLVVMAYADSENKGCTPVAYYWIEGETVYAGNEQAHALSPGIPVSERLIPDHMLQKFSEHKADPNG